MQVKELISGSRAVLRPTSSLYDAVALFHGSRLEGLPVVDEQDHVVGIFTKGQLFEALLAGRNLEEPVGLLMKTQVVTVPSKTSVEELAHEVKRIGVGQAPVTDDSGRLVGMLTKVDVIRALLRQKENMASELASLEEMVRELEQVKKLHQTLETVLELAYDGIVVVDEAGVITMANKSMLQFLGLSRDEVIGRPATELIEGTRLHIVAKTGVPELGQVQEMRGNKYVVSRLPLIEGGRVVGAVGKIVFRGLGELREVARRLESLENQVAFYKEELGRATGARYTIDSIVSQSPAMALLKRQASQAARVNATVLITGESGTGKELFAHAIHNASARRLHPFIKVNCAAIPEHLLESEFFGYADGAFTGARKGGKPGKFELANGGTIFLDEIGDMALPLQAKLLRVLQEKEVERVGGTKTIPVDVRVIAATNRDLRQLVEEGKLREDLYYRLNVITLEIPPLRDRKEDLLPLIYHLLELFNQETGARVTGVSPEALQVLQDYDWPGNVRELANAIERALSLDVFDRLEVEHLPPHLLSPGAGSGPAVSSQGAQGRRGGAPVSIRETVQEAERQAILAALEQVGGNRTKAAKLLGLSRSRFYEKLAQVGLK